MDASPITLCSIIIEINISKNQVNRTLSDIIKCITTRMTTSISSEARRNQTSILIRGREIAFAPKPDGQTDRNTDILTDGH